MNRKDEHMNRLTDFEHQTEGTEEKWKISDYMDWRETEIWKYSDKNIFFKWI